MLVPPRLLYVWIGAGALLLLLLGACGQAAPAAPLPATIPPAVVAASTVLPANTTVPAATALPVNTPLPAPTPVVVADPTPLPQDLREQIFGEVWALVAEHHLNADELTLQWAELRAEFAPQISAAATTAEFYALLAAMVARLDDQHSRILPPSDARREDVQTTGRAEQVGIGVLTLRREDGLMIQHVFPDSPAARAGLRPRDRIVTIDDVAFSEGRLEGDEGSLVRLMIARPGEDLRDVALNRKAVVGQIGPTVRRLADDVAYVGLTTLWIADMADQTATALAALEAEAPLRGVILDLRSNPGGWRNVLTGVLSHFVDGPVGDFYSRTTTVPFAIPTSAAPDLRGLPIVVLIDAGTASYAELLAGILQEEAGAVVIGMPSAGNTETIYAYELTGGARLWIAQEGFRLRNGVNLEGVGVRPDLLLADDWTRFSEATDPAILLGLSVLTAAPGK
jgi:C-terminal peptidase prc